jgi:hypothetical protein
MSKHLTAFALLLLPSAAAAQELSVNAFRNPSIGVEYRFHQVSAHVGYYPTNFEAGVTTTFFRAGLSAWLLAVDHKPIPSSFYISGSYLRGLSRDYEAKNAAMIDAGFRWMIWKGLNVRLGAAVLMADGHSPKLNPTPGIGYAFRLSPAP